MRDPDERVRRATCTSCRAWTGHLSLDLTDWEPGECRRHAPSPAGWPTTGPDDWCLDHDPVRPSSAELFPQHKGAPRAR